MGMNVGAIFNGMVQGMEYKKGVEQKNVQKPEKADKAEKTDKKNQISGGTDISKANEEKLSEKALNYLNKLREKYGDYDLYVGNDEDEVNALSKGSSKEFAIIFSNDELEKMADDEEYGNKQMKLVEDLIEQCKGIGKDENGDPVENEDGTVINKISIYIDSDGNTRILAEIEKSSERQRERIEKAREKKAEEKKAEEKKAEKKEAEEIAEEKAEAKNAVGKMPKNNPYAKQIQDTVKRTTVEATSIEELYDKIQSINWDSVDAAKSGDRFSFSV